MKESENLSINTNDLPSFEEMKELIELVTKERVASVERTIVDGTFEQKVEDYTLETCAGYQSLKAAGKEPNREEALSNCKSCLEKNRKAILDSHNSWVSIVQKLSLLKSQLP